MVSRRTGHSLLLLALLATGCSGDSASTICGQGTVPVNGRCETAVTCDPETTQLVDNVCQPREGEAYCGSGTQNVDGRCVPSATLCTDNTHLVGGVCVPNFDVVCGEGTALNEDGACEQVESLSCGAGTEEQAGTGGSPAQCVPICTGDQVYDATAEECVDSCGPGTSYNSATHVCDPRCGADQFYVSNGDTCVDVPRCLRNTAASDPDCVGWPFTELSLDTLCARRAFNLCEPMVDPACGCDHAGEDGGFTIAGAESSFLGLLPADLAGCVYGELRTCEDRGIGMLRVLEAAGQVAADEDALASFDAHFAIPSGTCTRPSGFEYWPVATLDELVDGIGSTGSACMHHLACPDTDRCAPELAVEGGIGTQPTGICETRSELRGFCQPDALNTFGAGQQIGPGPCAAGLRCQDGLCLEPKAEDEGCSSDSECAAGLVCRPANLSEIFEAGGPQSEGELDSPTCQPLLISGDGCATRASTGTFSWAQADYCPSTHRCLDSARAPENPNIGQCVLANGPGAACDYCDELQPRPFGASIALNPYGQDPYSICRGDLSCTFETLEEGWDETCVQDVSVCQPAVADIGVAGLGGICNPYEFVCDDGLDNDGDSDVDCADEDCATSPYTEVCNCDDVDEGGDPVDNDGDGLANCDDPDCAAAEACQ